MTSNFFTHPILNSPYEYPQYDWELGEPAQPIANRADARRPAATGGPGLLGAGSLRCVELHAPDMTEYVEGAEQ